MSADHLLKTGLVEPAKRKELDEYFEARRRFDDLFGDGPSVVDLADGLGAVRRRLEEARQRHRELFAQARDRVREIEATTVRPLGVILRGEPKRLQDVERAYAKARQAADGDPESNELSGALSELASLIQRIHAELAGLT